VRVAGEKATALFEGHRVALDGAERVERRTGDRDHAEVHGQQHFGDDADAPDIGERIVRFLHAAGDAVLEREDSAMHLSGGNGMSDLPIVAKRNGEGAFAKVPNECLVAEGTDLALEGDASFGIGGRRWHRSSRRGETKKAPERARGPVAFSA
jgi:hypothetical protein